MIKFVILMTLLAVITVVPLILLRRVKNKDKNEMKRKEEGR